MLPGMTAKVDIITGTSSEALQVPNAALRYRPKGARSTSVSRVWIFDGERLHPVAIQVGVSNEGMTEIVRGGLSEGTNVVIGDAIQTTNGSLGEAFRAHLIKIFGCLDRPSSGRYRLDGIESVI